MIWNNGQDIVKWKKKLCKFMKSVIYTHKNIIVFISSDLRWITQETIYSN